MNNIPLVAITDNKLSFALATLFVNLLETKNTDTFYELNAVVTPDFSEDNINKIKSIQEKYQNQCSINIVTMDNRFDNIKNETGYIANACAYKMCLAEILPQYDKIVYLDTDLMIFRDLTELYQINLENNYIGGVFSFEHWYCIQGELLPRLNIPDLLQYVNAGVLVLNLKKIREDNIEQKLQALIGSFNDSVDQHIFNKVCYGKIKLISPQWNVYQSSEWLYDSNVIEIYLPREEATKITNNPYIYHYTDSRKPWKYSNLKYALLWQKYYSISPYANEKIQIAKTENTSCKLKIRTWEDLENLYTAYQKYKKYKFLLKYIKSNKFQNRMKKYKEILSLYSIS